MTQTLDMMINMQKNGQQIVVDSTDSVQERREDVPGIIENPKVRHLEEREANDLEPRTVVLKDVVHDVDEILVGLGQAIDQKRSVSMNKMKAIQEQKAIQAYRSHLLFMLVTGGTVIAIFGIVYCLFLNLREDH